ncbi:hypothetical protein ACZ87_00316, partial [Candidatus Erwinia dacicola]
QWHQFTIARSLQQCRFFYPAVAEALYIYFMAAMSSEAGTTSSPALTAVRQNHFIWGIL